MKYFYQPNAIVIDYGKGKHIFQFNEKGEYETDDPKLIEWMKKNKWFIRCEDNAASDTIKCKKCDFTCSNKGELMAHYRKEHPKEE